MTNFCHSINFQDQTSTGFCGTSAHEYGKCHGINEISLLLKIDHQILENHHHILIYKGIGLEFSAEAMIYPMSFFPLIEVFRRFSMQKIHVYLKFGDPKLSKFF